MQEGSSFHPPQYWSESFVWKRNRFLYKHSFEKQNVQKNCLYLTIFSSTLLFRSEVEQTSYGRRQWLFKQSQLHKYITGFPNKLYKFKPNTPQNRQISSSKSQKKPFPVFWRHFWKPFSIWKLLLPSKIKLLIPHHGENIVGWSRGTPTGNLLLSRDRNGNFFNCIAKVR